MRINKKVGAGIIAVSIAAVTVVTAVFASVSTPVNNNPWSYALLAGQSNGCITAENKSLMVTGNIRSNGSINIQSDTAAVNGYAAAVSSVTGDISNDDIYENIDNAAFPNVYDNVYDIAKEYDLSTNRSTLYSENNLVLDDKADSAEQLSISVSSEIEPTDETESGENGKIGAFGASFFVKTYSNPEKWSRIFPVLYKTENEETNSLLELGQNSNFIPIKEQVVDDSWSDYDELPGAAVSNNFSETQLYEYMDVLKTDNPVTDICSEDSITIQANNTINPDIAEDAERIIVEGGHFSLDGKYDALEEIRFDSWGGSQLIGSYPNLKYIYKTSGSDLNLVGDFPSLECVYMLGGQLLLGSGDDGFNADGVKIINDYGPIAVYTAKDVKLTNSELATTQMILMRGAGADKTASVFNCENTIMAAKNGIMFEDMNDSNIRRYSRLPVYYSVYPMSVINCNFRLLQGTFIINNNAVIMANANIDKLRGYMFSPEGIDEYRNSSAVGFYLNTYAYNISPNINNLNKQPDGSEEIGRISAFEYAEFPRTLLNKITDVESFLADLKSDDNGFDIGESDKKPGELAIGRYIFANGDINISADTIVDQDSSFTVIASRNGNITIDTLDSSEFTAIVYAPNGNVTINGGTYNIKGRIFAQNIEINASDFNIISGSEDISDIGFVYNKEQDSSSGSNSDDDHSSDESSANDSDDDDSEDNDSSTYSREDESSYISDDSSKNDSSLVDDNSSSSGDESKTEFTEPQYEYDLLNRLIKVTYDEDNYIEYTYDANGNITNIVTVKDGEIQGLEDEE